MTLVNINANYMLHEVLCDIIYPFSNFNDAVGKV